MDLLFQRTIYNVVKYSIILYFSRSQFLRYKKKVLKAISILRSKPTTINALNASSKTFLENQIICGEVRPFRRDFVEGQIKKTVGTLNGQELKEVNKYIAVQVQQTKIGLFKDTFNRWIHQPNQPSKYPHSNKNKYVSQFTLSNGNQELLVELDKKSLKHRNYINQGKEESRLIPSQNIGFNYICRALFSPSLYFVSIVTSESGINLYSTVHVLVDVLKNPGLKTIRAIKTKDIGSYAQIISRVRRQLPKNIFLWTVWTAILVNTSWIILKFVAKLFKIQIKEYQNVHIDKVKIRLGKQELSCTICKNQQQDIVILPCTHFDICHDCIKEKKLCNVCNKDIGQKIRVYNS